MKTERLNKAKETFKNTYGFEPKFKLSSSSVVQVFDNGKRINMGVLNILALKDGEYKFTAMSDPSNENHKGKAVVKDGIITLYTYIYPNGHIVDQWGIEDFNIDGEIKYYPIAMWGEYPILVEL